ncbi:MAG TPA: NAD(+) synthase [Firmicutes bacterium]|nr:NAD(+) synthase [Bacillota bacterium]
MDCSRVADIIVEWIRERVRESRARGIVVGLSGGVDSAVVGALAKRAFPGAVLGLIMPAHSNPQDVEDALAVAGSFDIPTRTIDLGPLFDLALESFNRAAGDRGPGDDAPGSEECRGGLSVARANIKPRLRMITLYYFANLLNYLVAGTGNRSELEVGYFTKYGDGGVDILPIAGLVKSQVRELARYLGVPERVIQKPPSAGLWAGQTDEGEMGLAYEDLDRFILTGEADRVVREKIQSMHAKSEHKRKLPPVPALPPEILR